MAKKREGVSRQIKRALVREAGGKCANPGCTSYRTHKHHIREWAVWETNGQAHMIAICPTCHDAIHHGPLEITDETIYTWKSSKRTLTNRDHIYVEPGTTHKLLLGTVAVTGVSGAIPFEHSPMNRLSYRVKDEDIFLVDLNLSTQSGKEIVRVVDGHVKYEVEDPVRYDRVPGHIRITAPITDDLIPAWALTQIQAQEPEYARDGRIVLLDIEVIEPGLVRVQGIWALGEERIIVITKERLSFCRNPEAAQPLSIVGTGADTVLKWHGPIGQALFEFLGN